MTIAFVNRINLLSYAEMKVGGEILLEVSHLLSQTKIIPNSNLTESNYLMPEQHYTYS